MDDGGGLSAWALLSPQTYRIDGAFTSHTLCMLNIPLLHVCWRDEHPPSQISKEFRKSEDRFLSLM